MYYSLIVIWLILFYKNYFLEGGRQLDFWNSGNYTIREVECRQTLLKKRLTAEYPFCEINLKYIVRGHRDNRIYIYNRWTLEIEHVGLTYILLIFFILR